MYVGHVGIALGARGLGRSIPFWLLIVASQLPDWADAAFCVAGVRTVVPGMYTHSLPAAAFLALAAAAGYTVYERDILGIVTVASLVLSHIATDYLTGIKPTWSGGPMIGLELYRLPLIDFVIEAAVILAGWLLFRRSLPVHRRSSRPAWDMLTALILVQGAANIFMHVARGLRKC